MATRSVDTSVPRHSRRRWLFRCGGVAFGLSVLGLVELSLVLLGVERYYEPAAPMVGFSEVRPLFELDASGERFQIPKYRQVFFQPESFAAKKPSGQYRIFCFGGSTVQGRPYAIETAFSTWLELNLRAAEPERDWEVVNCGGVSYASYRLVPLLREALQYQPDLFIVYTGHNEFLEERSYASIKQQPVWLRNLIDLALQLRIAGVLRASLPAPKRAEPINLPAEVDALLDYQGGMAQYHRDDRWRQGVVAEYEQNLRMMVEIAREANVPLWFVNPVSNIRDTPPFKAEPPADFTSAQVQQLERLWEEAKAFPWEDLAAKEDSVQKVLALDAGHAEALFLLAKVHEAQGRMADAKRDYLRAKDEDVCPLRMLESMHEILLHVASRTGRPLINIRAQFEAEAEHGVPGDDQLIDHVHPRIEGHQAIAESLFQQCVQRGIVVNTEGWEARRQQLYRENYAGLPNNYFPESVARLEGLKIWAAGRARRLRLDPAISE